MPNQSSSFNNVDCSYFSLSALVIVATEFCDDVLVCSFANKDEGKGLILCRRDEKIRVKNIVVL